MYDVELPEQVELAGRTLHILPRASDVRMAVYVSEELLDGSSGDGAGARVAVCHRGTWSPADLLDDLHLLTGCFRASARYREAAIRSNALLAAWPAATFTHVGHSLGGSVAMALVQRMPAQVDAEAHAFNPGISLEGFASARATVHLIAGDVVGYGAPAHLGAQCHVYPPHAGVRYLPAFAHPHSLTNFW
jgi:pimeloyl-ACP methyl ester carboxylesterase